MKVKGTAILILALALFWAASAAQAQANSLWTNDSNLFADRKASGVGDIVMVKVNEKIDDSDEGKTSSSKTTDENVSSGFGILEFLRAFGMGSSSSMSSNTKLERTKTVTALFSCLVIDVLPNGNLVIQGDRLLTSGAEKMNVRFSGVVRPQDVNSGNVVESTRVANAEVVVTGRGVVSTTQRPGIISQIMKSIF
jgi:flagellar L-ring protein precursor FlgH